MTSEDFGPALPTLMMQRSLSLPGTSRPIRSSPLTHSTTVREEKVFKMISPKDGHENLNLTGNIISATCFLPYSVGFRPGGEWEIFPRRGSSALYDSLRHMVSPSSNWKTTLIGWTGEIYQLPVRGTGDQQNSTQANATLPLAETHAPPMARQKSYHVPPPIPLIKNDGNRMTMKGEYGKKKEEEEKVRITAEDREELQDVLSVKGQENGWGELVSVWLGDMEDEDLFLGGVDRWRNYAERVLWPLFHYIVPQNFSPDEGFALQERDWWRDYLRFNNAFADTILKVYKPGDVVWLHDYHLLMVPEILRQRVGKDIYIGLFCHAPWPTSEIFKVLSRRKPILEGMLASNMIGFQSETYKRHFISSCKRIIGFTESLDENGRVTGVGTYGAHCSVEAIPIGIDAEKVQRVANGPGIQDMMDTIRKGYGNRKIIVGRDRLDSVRGVVQKLRAFERFLELYPEYIGNVVLIQVTSPSSLSQSSTIEHEVSELVSHINGKYGSIYFAPVQHYPQYLQPHEYFALLRVADLGLITSIRDGMNTTSLEYVICQSDTHGPVILSEFTGTAESLTDAVIVNPMDSRGVANAIFRCLTFSEREKDLLHAKVYDYVTTNTVQTWNSRFLKKLLKELAHHKTHPMTPVLDKKKLLATYNLAGPESGKGNGRLFMFDYDGTLTPIVTDPEMAIPADKVVRSIKKLAQKKGNQVWIISGRDQKFLEEWLGHIGELGLSAEHGCFMRMPGSDKWENLAETMDMSWQKVAIDLFAKYTERTQGSFIERKNVAVTWHYRRADPEHGPFQARECMRELNQAMKKRNYDVEVMTGKANLEVRPRLVNKGEIAKKLINDYPEGSKPGLVFCAGDDTTDEDMFRALNDTSLPPEDVFTVTVGPSSKTTDAKYHLLEPADVIDSIGLLVGTVNPADIGVTDLVLEKGDVDEVTNRQL